MTSTASVPPQTAAPAFGKFFRTMLNAGIYLPPSQFEAAFLSAAHSEEDVQKTIVSARNSLRS